MKNITNAPTSDYMDNSFTQKKEEKTHSQISLIEPIFQPIAKSGISNKK